MEVAGATVFLTEFELPNLRRCRTPVSSSGGRTPPTVAEQGELNALLEKVATEPETARKGR